jgi:hypothetical protein
MLLQLGAGCHVDTLTAFCQYVILKKHAIQRHEPTQET